MSVQDKKNLIQNFLENLDTFNVDFFFPLDRTLVEDIKEKWESKSDEEKNILKNFFYFPLEFETSESNEQDVTTSTIGDKESDLGTLSETIDQTDLGTLSETIDQTDLGMPTETIDQTDLEIPTETIDQTDLGMPTETIDQTDLGMPTETIDQTDLGMPTETIDQTDLGIPTETIDQTDLGIPTETIDQTDLGIPTETIDQTDLGTLSETIDQTDLGIPTETIDQTDLGTLSETIDQTDLGMPTETIDQTDLGMPTETIDQTDLGTLSETIDQTDLGIPTETIDQTDLEIPTIEDNPIVSHEPLDTETEQFQNQMTQSTQKDLEQEDILLNEEELKDMHAKSLLEEGIGSEFTEEDLAKLRESLLSYSEPLRKVIIDSIVNEKISQTDQRVLINMLIEGVDEPTLLDFIEEKLGFRPKVAVDKTKEGIPIIYVDEISPEALERKRKRAKLFLILSSVFFTSIFFLFLGTKFYNYYRTTNLYELGLEELKKAEKVELKDKEAHIQKAEEYFHQALRNEGEYNITYLHKYADSYIRLGKYEKAFEKLFGKIDPEYAWNSPSLRVPLIQKSTSWKSLDEIQKGYYTEFFSKDQIKRKLLIPGAFTVLKLRYDKYDKDNLIYLAKFHSLNIPHFLNSEEGKKYKNDSLAIDYYKIILTLLNKPNDPDALSGIGKIYYNQKKFSMASEEYQKIIDIYPNNIQGHDGILNTYIEIWKENKDPRYVIAKHRYLQKLGLEEDLPIYTLAKLAGFYTDIDPEELRIKYNIDPVDTLTQLTIEGNIQNLLNLIYNKKEKRGEEILQGNQYGEGFYQRGRFLFKKKEYQNSIKQFQNAFYYDFKHFPALYYIGLYYLKHLKDYEKAKEYFLKALEVYNQYKDYYGIRPEDETMLSFNKGLIYYDLVSTVFEKQKNNWIPPVVSLNEPNENYQTLLKEIISTEEYNELAIQELNEESKLIESIFRKGVIEYVNGNFRNALNIWLKIENTEILKSPNYFLSLGNASFYSDQKKQALNFYNQARYLLESKEKLNDLEKKMLYFIFNNLGTTYESLAKENRNKLPKYKIEELQQQSLEYYYKAIEYALQNKILPNRAKLNIDLFLKRDAEKLLLEDEILFNF